MFIIETQLVADTRQFDGEGIVRCIQSVLSLAKFDD